MSKVGKKKFVCGDCQAVVDDTQKFCHNCGAGLQSIDDAVKPGKYITTAEVKIATGPLSRTTIPKGTKIEISKAPKGYKGDYVIYNIKSGEELTVKKDDPAMSRIKPAK